MIISYLKWNILWKHCAKLAFKHSEIGCLEKFEVVRVFLPKLWNISQNFVDSSTDDGDGSDNDNNVADQWASEPVHQRAGWEADLQRGDEAPLQEDLLQPRPRAPTCNQQPGDRGGGEHAVISAAVDGVTNYNAMC